MNRYCNMDYDVATSAKLVQALQANGAVNNSITEMIGINIPQVEALEREKAAYIRQLQECGDHLVTKFDQDVTI